MRQAVVYIHGKGGNAEESAHYQALFSDSNVIGFDYHSQAPWEARNEFSSFFKELREEYDSLVIVANSIGAFFAMNSLDSILIDKAFFISPIVNMEKLILDMMTWSGVDERRLQQEGIIETAFGETLSMEYLTWVRENPVSWDIPTAILYGSRDNLQAFDTIRAFAVQTGAKLTIMENGEHWFHTDEQMTFLDNWIREQG